MNTTSNPGFNPFAPGLDFLQGLVKGASAAGGAAVPPLGHWVAPTMDPEELDKRISELKTVHYWLDQNTKALSATIQAMEVQKLTLATLKEMNVNLGDIARAFQAPAATTPASTAPAAQAGRAQDPAPAEPTSNPATSATPSGLTDPLQMWSALTQQFQHIAASAIRDTSQTKTDETSTPAHQSASPAKHKKPDKTSVRNTAKTVAKKKAPSRPPVKSANKRSA